MTNYYKKGDWNAICALCGGKFKASELRWNSQINDWVCKRDWEVRHPQERIKAKKDIQSVPWTRPDPEPIDLYTHYVVPDYSNPAYPLYVEFGYWI
jgi:hypothetical protein